MIFLLIAACIFTTSICLLGSAWPLVARLRLSSLEKFAATLALSQLILYLLGGAIYVCRAPVKLLWVIPLLALLGLSIRLREFLSLWRDPAMRATTEGCAWLAVWSLGWLSIVVIYSGGGWAADWFEHWERMRFFLERWPADHAFLGVYALPARPPLANLVSGALLAPINLSIPYYQVVSILLSCLVVVPGTLLAQRFGAAPPNAARLLTVALMVSPLFVQNATFAWTKLPAASFVLTGLYFVLRARDTTTSAQPLLLAALCLAGGLLAHYSAGPYAVALALLWCAGLLRAVDRAARLRVTMLAGGAAALLLLTWFGYTAATYGRASAFSATTTIKGAAASPWAQLEITLLNFRDTLVPHFLRPMDRSLIDQPSPWGAVRDFFFQAYQLNLLLAFGSAAGLVLLRTLYRRFHDTEPSTRRFWTSFAAIVIVLGIATHSSRDTWGLTHISLQAIVLLGLCVIVAEWPHLGSGWRRMLIAGAAVDLTFGIVLHFAVQGFLIDRWWGGSDWARTAMINLNPVANIALMTKFRDGHIFLNDVLPVPAELVLALLAGLLMLAICRTRRAAS